MENARKGIETFSFLSGLAVGLRRDGLSDREIDALFKAYDEAQANPRDRSLVNRFRKLVRRAQENIDANDEEDDLGLGSRP